MTPHTHPVEVAGTDIFQKCYDFTRVDEIKAAGLYPYFIPIEGSEGTSSRSRASERSCSARTTTSVSPMTPGSWPGRAGRPPVRTGCTGSRLLNGTLDLHEKLEHDLAQLARKKPRSSSRRLLRQHGVISTLVPAATT